MASKNPLYPGYYPGEKIPPERGGGGGRREFSQPPGPDAVENFLNVIDESNFGFLNMPKWIWEQEKKAMEMAWKANYYGDEIITPTEASVGGEEELEDLPGSAAVGVNLNPVDWVNDPKKQLKGATIDPITSIIDKDDFLQKTKAEVWKSELLIKEEAGGQKNPFYLSGETLLETDGKSKPLYSGFKEEVPKYFGNSNNFFFRNSSLDAANKEAIAALDNELAAKRGYFDDKVAKDVIDPFRKKVKAVDVFEGLGVVDGVGGGAEDLRVDGIGLRTKGTKFDFSKLKDSNLDAKSVSNLFGGDEVNITNITKSLKNVTEEYDKKFFRAKGSDVKSHVNGLNLSLIHANEVLSEIDGTEGLRKYVGNLQGILKDHTTVENGVLTVKEGFDNKLFQKLKTQRGRLYRKTVDGGVLGGYIRNVVDEDIKNGNSQLNKVLTSATHGDGRSIMSDESKRLHYIFGNVSAEWKRQTSKDLAKSLAKGDLPSSFIYQNIIQPRIQHYTPSYWINRGLGRVHHFGFVTNKDLLGDDPKIPSNRIAKFIEKTPLVKDHKFEFAVAGEKLVIKGGKHLEVFKELQKISIGSEFAFDISKITGGNFVQMLNASGIADLKNNFGLSEEVAKKLLKVKEAIKNRATLREALGVAIDKDGSFILTHEGRFKKFFEMFSGDKLKDIGLDPTLSKIGVMQRYSLALSRLREAAYSSRLGKFILARVAKFQAEKEFFVKKLSKLISKAFVALTDGAGIVIEWFIRIAVEYTLEKLQNAFKKWWKALKKLDFTDIIDDLEKNFKKVGRAYLWGCSIGCGIPLILLLMFFTLILTTFSSFNAGKIGQDAIGAGNLFTRDTYVANCNDKVENPSEVIGPNNQGGVAGKAFDLVEGLERGFWCYFNRHPDYDDASDPVDLFDEQRYSVDPNISSSVARNIWDLLFWCTYLPDKAGANIPKAEEYCKGKSWATADGMQTCYQNKPGTVNRGFAQYPHYVSAEDAYVNATPSRGGTAQNVFPGDVIFIKSGNSSRTSNHVGVVYKVTPDFVTTVQSNTGLKVWSYPVDDDGSILGVSPHKIVGFGR